MRSLPFKMVCLLGLNDGDFPRNTKAAVFDLPGQNINLPLIVVLFGAFIIGIVFGMFALFGRLLSLRSENNRLRVPPVSAAVRKSWNGT